MQSEKAMPFLITKLDADKNIKKNTRTKNLLLKKN